MAGNPSVGALASGAQAKARGLHTKPHSYLASPFPFAFLASAAWSACPSAWGTIAPADQCIPLTELLCLFLFFWRASSCWLPCVMLTTVTLPFCTLLHFSFLNLIQAHHPDFPLSLPLHIWPPWLSCLLPWSFLPHFNSVAQSCLTLCDPMTAARQASLSITNSWSLLKLISVESKMPSNHLILCHPLLLLPSIFPSIRVFSIESVLCIRWWKDWSFSFSISPSNEYSGLISFRIDWLDLLAVQGTLKSLLQHHSSKASILQCSAFFIVQLSHPYMTTGKTIALTRRTFVGKVMSLFFNMLSFLPRSKHLLISWLQSSSAVILKLKKIKSATVSTFYPSICHEVMGPDTHLNSEFQRIARRDKKAFLSDQLKEIVENNRMGKIRDFFKKIRDTKEYFVQRWAR